MKFTHSTSRPRLSCGVWIVWLAFSVLWSPVAFAATYGGYGKLNDADLARAFQVVEGTVKIIHLEAEPKALAAAQVEPFEMPPFPTVKGPVGQVLQYAWLAIPLGIVLNALAWRLRGRKHIARDPSLRAGYNRMALGFALWGSLPFVLWGLALEIDRFVSLPGDLSSELEAIRGPLFSSAFFIVSLLWLYWVFARDGAAKLARHPGLIEQEWVAKAIPLVVVAAQVIDRVAGLFN